MKTRTRNRSQKAESQSSSNSLQIKRRKCKILPIQRKRMIDAEWPNYDAQLLTMLADGRDRNHGDYSVEFYKSLAATLSDNAGTRFSSRDVGGRAEYHRRTYQRSQGGTFTHRVMSAGDYELWLERCFDAPTDRAIRIPRCLTSSRNERSRRSRSSCPSRSCPSVSQATMHQVAEMTSEDWAEYDAYLLKRLGDVVKRGDLSMGTRYTERFYEEFALKLAAVTGQEITAQDVIDRVHRLREIYHDCKADGVFHHDVMKSDEFCYRMKRCFGLTYGKKPRIPRSRLSSLHTWNVGSGSGAGSGSGSGSVSSASVSNEPTSLEKALARLHTRNRARLDGHRCLLFTRLLKRDPQVSKLFLALKTPEEKLNFIDDQKLERFDV